MDDDCLAKCCRVSAVGVVMSRVLHALRHAGLPRMRPVIHRCGGGPLRPADRGSFDLRGHAVKKTQDACSALDLEVLQASACQAPSSTPEAERDASYERPSGQAPSLEEALPNIPDAPVSQDSNSPVQEAPELTSRVQVEDTT